MSVSLPLLTRLFQLISERKFAEAERIMERLTGRMKKSGMNNFDKGYLQALNGIILTYRSGTETYEFFSTLNIKDVEAIKKHYKDFVRNSQSRFHADYDRGFFTALADYMRVVMKTAQADAKYQPVQASQG